MPHPAEPMLVVSDRSFPVGLVRWPDPTAFTLIAKLTFSLASSGRARFAKVQEPLSIDQLDDTGAELRYASDFVPYKQGVDITLVGHARAPSVGRALPARLKVGSLDKSFKVTAEHPSHVARLSRRTVVAADARVGGAVGPRLASDPRARSGWAEPGFQLGAFNSAPPDQRVSAFLSDSVLILEGLFGNGSSRVVRLPAMAPSVGMFRDTGHPVGALPMHCDTVWIDTDLAICVLVYRVVLRCPSLGGATPVAAVSLGLDSSMSHHALLMTHAGRPAMEREDFDSIRPNRTLVLEPEVPAPAVQTEEEVTLDIPTTLDVVSPAHTVLPPPHGLGDELTAAMGPAPQAPDDVLPFRAPSLSSAPPPDPLRRVPATSDVYFTPAAELRDEPTAKSSPAPKRVVMSTPPPEPRLDVEQYATIKAAVFRGGAPLGELLEPHGLTEMQWREEAEAWHHRLAAEADAGGGALANALLAAIVRASRAS